MIIQRWLIWLVDLTCSTHSNQKTKAHYRCCDKGFKRASTNKIAQADQIGKGILFYYFGSKEELFDLLCEYAIEFAKTIYLSRFKLDTGDFLERYQKLTEIKRQAIAEYPLPIAFFESFYKEGNEKYIAKYVRETNALREQVVSCVNDGIDYLLFRDDIDGKTTVKYVKWLFDAYQMEVTERFKRGEVNTEDDALMSSGWKWFADFCTDMRKLFYKEGQ